MIEHYAAVLRELGVEDGFLFDWRIAAACQHVDPYRVQGEGEITMTKKESPLPGQVLASVEFDNANYQNPPRVVSSVDEANLITSRVADCDEPTHKLVLDIDLPAKLIPSSTPGHFHLFVDKEIPEDHYFDLLDQLAACGIIEPGYADASISRGFSAARLPWVKKPAPKPELHNWQEVGS